MKESLENFIVKNIVNTRNMHYQIVAIQGDEKIPDYIIRSLDNLGLTLQKKTAERISYILNDHENKKHLTLVDNSELSPNGQFYADFIRINEIYMWQVQFNGEAINRVFLLKIVKEILDRKRIDVKQLKTMMLPLFPECNFSKIK